MKIDWRAYSERANGIWWGGPSCWEREIRGEDDDQGRGADKPVRSVRVDEVISHPTGTHRRKPEKPQYSGNIGNQAENRAGQNESRYKII